MRTTDNVSPIMRDEAARIFGLRCALGLTQADFADRFGLSVGTIQNVEQARFAANRLMRLALVAIELDPALMERAAGIARDRLDALLGEADAHRRRQASCSAKLLMTNNADTEDQR